MRPPLVVLALILLSSFCFSGLLGDPVEEEEEVTILDEPLVDDMAGNARVSSHLHRSTLDAVTRSTGRAHQVAEPSALFSAAGDTLIDRIENGMLVCRVGLTGGGYDEPSIAGGADVYMSLSIGGGPRRRTAQTSTRTYSFPVADLARGDALSVRVMDQDVFNDDLIGTGSGAFVGGPTSIIAGGAMVICRPVAPEVVARGLERAQTRLRTAVEALGTPAPDLTASNLGYPSRDAAVVLRDLRRVLAWSETPDASVEALLSQAANFETRWEEAVVAAIDETVENAPVVGQPVELPLSGALSTDGVLCDDTAGSARRPNSTHLRPSTECLLIVTLTASAPGRRTLTRNESLGMASISNQGQLHELRDLGQRLNESWLAPGVMASFDRGDRLTMYFEVPRGAVPRLVRVSRLDRRVFLRVSP